MILLKKIEMSFCLFLGKTDAETIFGEVSDRKQDFIVDKKFDFTIFAKLVAACVTDALNRLYHQSVCELVYNKALSFFNTAK